MWGMNRVEVTLRDKLYENASARSPGQFGYGRCLRRVQRIIRYGRSTLKHVQFRARAIVVACVAGGCSGNGGEG